MGAKDADFWQVNAAGKPSRVRRVLYSPLPGRADRQRATPELRGGCQYRTTCRCLSSILDSLGGNYGHYRPCAQLPHCLQVVTISFGRVSLGH